MEQHPIPQNISSYQFRLVGDMTLKQFFELAGGIVVGLIFYSSPLLPIIKWPFAIISVILGIALAFLPLEERPLERWIIAFFRAIYSPTLYYWRSGSEDKKFFQDESQDSSLPQIDTLTQKFADSQEVEAQFLKPEATTNEILVDISSSPAPQPLPSFQSNPLSSLSQPKTTFIPQTNQTVTPLNIPTTKPIKIEPLPERKTIFQETPVHIKAAEVTPILAGDKVISTKQAIFSLDAAPPNPPTTPNVIAGQVVDQDRKIVEGVIMEIRDSAGRPVRALKSNKLGHFIIVTPLDNGKYTIVAEKDGLEFAPVNFEAVGQLIPPILVQGKKTDAN